MNRKLIAIPCLLTVLSLLLAACQATAPPPQVVEVTRPVEVTRIVEVTVQAPAGTPQVQVRVVEPTGGTLEKVKSRGKLVCGVHGTFNGFGFLSPDGKWSGFDVDFCRAWAAALFDDPNAVEFRPLSASERFTAVQTGEVDVLSRNSTKTLARETELKLQFGPVVFYDGQAMLVHKEVTDDPKAGLEVLEGGSVCVQTGTTTELNLADQMRAAGVNYTPVVFDDQNAAFQAYDEGRCDGITSDRSQLVTQGSAVLKDFSQHTLLDVVMSKEPLAPATLHGDDEWADFIAWVIYGMITAEELGITSQNVESFMNSQDPTVRRLLGLEGDMGVKLGVTNDFMVRVLKHVGNYGEVFDRNLGPGTPFNLARGQNALWTQGGLMYAPPFR